MKRRPSMGPGHSLNDKPTKTFHVVFAESGPPLLTDNAAHGNLCLLGSASADSPCMSHQERLPDVTARFVMASCRSTHVETTAVIAADTV